MAGRLMRGLALLSAILAAPAARAAGLDDIDTIVVIYAENRSFDHLYGLFPGANGIGQASIESKTQRGHDNEVLADLGIWDGKGSQHHDYPRVPNGPFQLDAPPHNKSQGAVLLSPIHAFFHNREQINGGRNDRFAAMSNVGGYAMGYFDGSKMKLWQWAKEYTLADNFFMGAFGGSFLNHQYLVCACAPVFDTPPVDPVLARRWEAMKARLDDKGLLLKLPDSPPAGTGAVKTYSVGLGGMLTPAGRAVNTTQPPFQPSGLDAAAGAPEHADPAGNDRIGLPLPPQTAKTIGDTLSAKGIGWAWYAGAWTEALADSVRPVKERKVIYTRKDGALNFQPHHQPFNYFARFAPGKADRAAHLKDGAEFLLAIEKGTLPKVSFYKPTGLLNQHPSYTSLMQGDAHIADILERLAKSPQWGRMLVIVTYDENGGFWDHVAPPTGPGAGDEWGPGTRVPAIIVSPHVKRGHVDHTSYDTGSIIRLITRRFGLEPLPGVRGRAGDLSAALAVN